MKRIKWVKENIDRRRKGTKTYKAQDETEEWDARGATEITTSEELLLAQSQIPVSFRTVVIRNNQCGNGTNKNYDYKMRIRKIFTHLHRNVTTKQK